MVYKKKLINDFRYREGPLSCMPIFSFLMKQSHPLLGIGYRFDARFHRFMRLTTYLF
jgi:hypothetical protein